MSDLISRQDVLDLARSKDDSYTIADFIEDVECLPSADRPKGKWIDTDTSYSDTQIQRCKCSICGKQSTRPLGYFCRWCGADMRGTEHE